MLEISIISCLLRWNFQTVLVVDRSMYVPSLIAAVRNIDCRWILVNNSQTNLERSRAHFKRSLFLFHEILKNRVIDREAVSLFHLPFVVFLLILI